MPILAKKFIHLVFLIGLSLFLFALRPVQAAAPLGFLDLPVPPLYAEPAGPELPPATIQSELLAVCQGRGYGKACAKTLLGMLWKESRGVADAIGDRGKARGYFQIHYRLHGITVGCAEDLRCSADWTISYLEQNGYPAYAQYAVQCHNGCNVRNGYAASAVRHGERLWQTPIVIEGQGTQLAMAVK
jgi:hypothetical protein